MKNFLFNLKLTLMGTMSFALLVSSVVFLLFFAFDGCEIKFLILSLLCFPIGLALGLTLMKLILDWMD